MLLTWQPPVAGPRVTYNVYRSATAPVPVDDAHRIASGLRVGLYLDPGGAAGLYYVVTAQNAAGESGPSNTARARGVAPLRLYRPDPLLLLPAPLVLLALGRSQRRLRWAAPVGAVLLAVAGVCLGAGVLLGGGAGGGPGAGRGGAGGQEGGGGGGEESRGVEGMGTRGMNYMLLWG